MAEETKKNFIIVLILQDKKFCNSEWFKVIQDGIPLIFHHRTMSSFRDDFFKYIYHAGCAINLHSIIKSGLIPGGEKLSKKTDGILHVCGSYELGTWKIFMKSNFNALASCLVQAKGVEATSEHIVLVRHPICWTERIWVLSDTIERDIRREFALSVSPTEI